MEIIIVVVCFFAVPLSIIYLATEVCFHDWIHEYTSTDQDQMPIYYVYKCRKCRKQITLKKKIK